MEHAPEGKDPDGPSGGGGGEGGDVAETTATTTKERCDALQAMMKDETFDINETPCGPKRWCPLEFALGGEDDPIDDEAVKLVLAVPGVDTNGANSIWGEPF